MLLHEQVYEELVRIPLILSLPRSVGTLRAHNGTSVASVAKLIDVAPTVLELTGLPPIPHMQGQSLVQQLASPPEERLAFFRNQSGTQYGVTDGRWKLIQRLEAREVA